MIVKENFYKKVYSYFFFRKGNPVFKFTLTLYPAGLSMGSPLLGFFALKK